MQVEIHKRVQRQRAEADRAAEHERRTVARLGREITRSALRIFPAPHDDKNQRAKTHAGQQQTDRTPVHQQVEIIVMHAYRSGLQCGRPVSRKTMVEMRRANAE